MNQKWRSNNVAKTLKQCWVFVLPFVMFQVFSQNVNIPDLSFKNHLLNDIRINTNGDNEIQVSEAEGYQLEIDVSQISVSDLTGLEAFDSIVSLNCNNVGLTILNISGNTELQTLYCNHNQLTTIDLSNQTKLTTLQCNHNSLLTLDLSNNISLREVYCIGNELSNLNLMMLPEIRVLYCSENFLTNLQLADGTISKHFNRLKCDQNQLTALDLSSYPTMDYLDCSDNALIDLDVSNGNNFDFLLFHAENNNLTCIGVDHISWSNINWDEFADPGVSFSLSCP